MLHVLALPGWYPSKLSPYNGDFVQRHLQAIALECKVTAIYVLQDSTFKLKEIEKRENGNLTEYFFYIPARKSIIGKWYSYLTYYQCINTLVKKIKKEQHIDLIHIHVVKVNGLYALFKKLIKHQKYLITEHSTEYIDGRWDHYSRLKKWLIKKIFVNAQAVNCVSKYLQQQLEHKIGKGLTISVIPNVVNTNIFYPLEQENHYPPLRFIHISSLNDQKNIPFILEGFRLLNETGRLFHLTIVGPSGMGLEERLAEMKLSEKITRLNEMPQPQLATNIQQSDVLVLFSKYETFGCVIIEAMACGKPVIVNDLPVMKEIVINGMNGMICPNDNIHAFVGVLIDFIDKPTLFQKDLICQNVNKKYSYHVVAKQFLSSYKKTLSQ